MIPFFESLVTTNFSFLQSASHAEEFIVQAAALGISGIAIADHNSLAGVVRGHLAAAEQQLPFRVGARLLLYSKMPVSGAAAITTAPLSIAVYPTDRNSYGALCRVLSFGKLRAEKGQCYCLLDEFLQHSKALCVTLLPHDLLIHCRSAVEAEGILARFMALAESLPDRKLISVALAHHYDNPLVTRSILNFANKCGLSLIATSDPCMHSAERKVLLDVLSCISRRCTINQIGTELLKNAERCLKSPNEIAHLFRATPKAITRTQALFEMTSRFSLEQLAYEYPEEVTPRGQSPIEYLTSLSFSGAQERYPTGIPEQVLSLLREELALIRELRYEKYFLTCHDIVRYARSRGILCQGRGAAANSVVCFCLGITSVDPTKIDLLFARFVSRERSEPPDIDIDFEHERREEVMQYIYERFGRERAGLGCAVITYRTRSAVREIGKVLGLGNDAVDTLAKLVHRWTDNVVSTDDLNASGLNPEDRRIQLTFSLAQVLKGFPRHLTQHVGGFIICQYPLIETVPILNSGMEGRTIIEWDKDDIEALGMLKIDILALGMLSCIKRALDLIAASPQHYGGRQLELHTIPSEDPATYDRICAADTIGVFQIESRAQMSMLPRLKPRCFYDLVIEVAIVRPGPIQGNMVHPYLRRRSGLETPFYPDERARSVLGKTLGVPIFQEQAMRLAIVLANFTPEEAEGLRRAMAAWKRDKGRIALFKARVIAGMVANGYSESFADNCMNQIRGFSEYGFPESHAASFALLVYASAWIKTHYPVHFTAALLNSQPMGFYAPAQLVSDLERHGFCVLPIDILESEWDCTVVFGHDGAPSLRLGLRLIKGLSERHGNLLVATVREYKFLNQSPSLSPLDLMRRLRDKVGIATLERLARADVFVGCGLAVRDALWQIRALPELALPFEQALPLQSSAVFPAPSIQQSMFADLNRTGVSLRAHPIGLVREQLSLQGVSSVAALRKLTQMRKRNSKPEVAVAGIAFVKQRPGTAKGMLFISLEDETGIVNLVIKPAIFERFRRPLLMSQALLARGILERVDAVLYVNVESVISIDKLVTNGEAVDLSVSSYSY